ncbi:MAG TPA: GH1 family beta-glucosidase [Gemmatimonadaceae bacterium]|nr:GH1 family beta-glucosidase [Gemmatimonadaceae bacterium]
MSESFEFPAAFLWGAATSAYQIEGSPLADGAGQNIWHRFSHTPGMTTDGDTGDVACDHYTRYESDVALMKELGLNAYRFSIAWGRVMPRGRGTVNPRGLDFYSRLVDTLLENGIRPNATLYHWDLPSVLDDAGGWLNRDIADWFGDYAKVVFDALGDRVPMWGTINEPWVIMDGGYMAGKLAPGHRSLYEPPIVSHNVLRAHGRAVQAFRASKASSGAVGLIVNIEPKYPASNSEEDRAATMRADAYMNRQYLDPVFLGRYPEEMAAMFGEAWLEWPDEDMSLIGERTDFLGINYYTRCVSRNDDGYVPTRASGVRQDSVHTETGWEVYPDALTRTLVWVRDRYGDIPLYITENGAAFDDPPTAIAGRIDDPLRVAYLRDHLRAAREAMRQGVPIRGYYAWSLLDNFEWSHGYSKRFGIVHVDYATLQRTVKESGKYYSRIVRSNGAALDKL